MSKKAYLVDMSFRVRIVVDDHLDPDIDNEFVQLAFVKMRQVMGEGPSGIADNIEEIYEDDECPYDPETDN